jgi:hypothetical protein
MPAPTGSPRRIRLVADKMPVLQQNKKPDVDLRSRHPALQSMCSSGNLLEEIK